MTFWFGSWNNWSENGPAGFQNLAWRVKQDCVEVFLDSTKQDMRITGAVVSYSHMII